MSVKLGNILSKPQKVTGVAVQGSVLGVLDHNVVLNDPDNGVHDNLYIAKNINDMTLIDAIPNKPPT